MKNLNTIDPDFYQYLRKCFYCEKEIHLNDLYYHQINGRNQLFCKKDYFKLKDTYRYKENWRKN